MLPSQPSLSCEWPGISGALSNAVLHQSREGHDCHSPNAMSSKAFSLSQPSSKPFCDEV